MAFSPFESLAGVTLEGEDLADHDLEFLTDIARSKPTSLDDLFEAANLNGFAGLDDSDTLARTFRPLP